ncbi:MAG: hypothetical protein ABIG11_05840 [bacterium]
MVITELLRPGSKRKTATPETGETAKTRKGCVVLDHPQHDEKITSPHYTFRIGATGDMQRVEISLNDGPWQACRHSVGYWWYDWSGYAGGRHQAEVRAWTKNGRVLTSEPRNFQVDGKRRNI